VLIVDDEADVRESLDLFFKALGAEVKQALPAKKGCDSGRLGIRPWCCPISACQD
jgi:hypothetical protein